MIPILNPPPVIFSFLEFVPKALNFIFLVPVACTSPIACVHKPESQGFLPCDYCIDGVPFSLPAPDGANDWVTRGREAALSAGTSLSCLMNSF